MSIPSITIQSTKLKELLTLAKFSWLKFTASFVFQDQSLSANLRFLDFERKIGVSSVNELIFEAPEKEDLLEILQKEDVVVNFCFSFKSETYSFTTTYLDTYNLAADLAVVSFKFPAEINKKSKRGAYRIKNNFDLGNEIKPPFVRDISIKGFSLIAEEKEELEKQPSHKIFLIPVLKKDQDQLYFLLHKLKLNYKVVRKQVNKNSQLVLGAHFLNLKPFQMLIIQEYIKIRKKEEDFFHKNQYYPKIVLPAIDLA